LIFVHGEERDNPRSINSKSIWQRAQIFSAGVIMNFILAIVLLSIGYTIGLPSVVDENQTNFLKNSKVQITDVAAGSPADEAGMKIGDEIIKVKSQKHALESYQGSKTKSIIEVKDLQSFIEKHKGEEIILTIKRGQEEMDFTIVPRKDPPEREGPLGIGLAKTAIVSYPIHKAIYQGIKATINLTILIIVLFAKLIWGIITTGHLIFEIGGPVAIASLTGEAAQMGFIYVLQLTALISINLAVINALPFPALDGGHLFFLVIEKIKGKPVKREVLNTINNIGFAFLMFLILVVTYRDIARFDIWERILRIF